MTTDVSSALRDKRLASLARMDKFAWWLDDAFRVPIINRRVGVDGLFGLIPFAGDLIGAGLSSVLVVEAVRLGAPKRVWMKMGTNVGIDFVVGLVPIVGDLFDMAWKANRRNERVMRRWLEQVTAIEEKKSKWPGTAGITLGLAGALLVTVVLWKAMFG